MKSCFRLCYYVIFLFLTQMGLGYGKLLFLQSLFRHGDRSPTHLFPNDLNDPAKVWPQGLGKLTQLGKKQHYMVGKQIAALYSDFITSDPKEVFVNSTDVDRCLRSAECHLAGLYEPKPEWQFQPGYQWQPIPIHYKPKHLDIYLNPNIHCHRANEESRRIFHSPEFKKFKEENEPMLKNMSSCAGEKLTHKNAYVVATAIKIEMEYNLPVPPCVLPYYDQLHKYADTAHNFIYKSAFIRKIRAGPLLGKIIDNINRKISGEIPEQKVQVYSARDRNVVAMLSLLGLSNGKIPPYASTMLFELHNSDTDDMFTIRLLLFNSTRPQDGDQTPHVLQLPGCSEYCPLEYFDNYTRPLIPQDFKEECKHH